MLFYKAKVILFWVSVRIKIRELCLLTIWGLNFENVVDVIRKYEMKIFVVNFFSAISDALRHYGLNKNVKEILN